MRITFCGTDAQLEIETSPSGASVILSTDTTAVERRWGRPLAPLKRFLRDIEKLRHSKRRRVRFDLEDDSLSVRVERSFDRMITVGGEIRDVGAVTVAISFIFESDSINLVGTSGVGPGT